MPRIGTPADYVTPHEALLAAVRRGTRLRAAAAPRAAQPALAAGKLQPVGIAGLDALFDEWDPERQVSLGFAAEEAAAEAIAALTNGPSPRPPKLVLSPAPAATPAKKELLSPNARGVLMFDQFENEAAAVPSRAPAVAAAVPSRPPAEAAKPFSDMARVRRQEAAANAARLAESNPGLAQLIAAGKACPACYEGLSALRLRRFVGKRLVCQVCEVGLCSKCADKMPLPPHFARELAAASADVCRGCRRFMGGVQT